MAISLYDEALASKLNKWIKTENLRVLKPEETSELFKINADTSRTDSIKLPLIALSRKTKMTITNTSIQPKSRDGIKIFAYDKDNKLVSEANFEKMQKLRVIPITLEYQLDIYTASLAEADEYFRDFAFGLINEPDISIEIPYNKCHLRHDSVITLDEDVEDNSDIPQRLFPTQFTRLTLTMSIDDAYLFSAPIKNNLKVSEVKVRINEGTKDKEGKDEHEDLTIYEE